MPYRPRAARDRERMAAAATNVRATGGSATSVALAQIGAAFGEAAVVNDFKVRVERLLRLGPQHTAVRARFGARAAMLSGCDLETTIADVKRELGSSFISNARETISKARDTASSVDEFVHGSPWAAVAIGAGLGLLVGMILKD